MTFERNERVEVVISPEAQSIMDSVGMSIEGDFLICSNDSQLRGVELKGEDALKFEIEKGEREREIVVKLTKIDGRVLALPIHNGIIGFPKQIS